jgi:ribosome recycling factor
MLVVSPWDKGSLPAIERAIMKSGLGLNPSSDGSIIRLIIPQLTEETRRNLVKNVHKRVEEGKVAVRNIRRDVIEDLRTFKKGGDIGEDEEKRTEGDVQKITDRHIHELDALQKSKEAELLEV